MFRPSAVAQSTPGYGRGIALHFGRSCGFALAMPLKRELTCASHSQRGDFSMKAFAFRFAAVLLIAIGMLHAQAPDISGNWPGTL
jgi:hypothetical protein